MKLDSLNSIKGLTLIELMISVAIMTLVTVGALHVLLTAQALSEDSRGRLLAVNAANSTLEAIKETPLTSLATIDTTDFVPANLPSGAITIGTNPVDVSTSQIATVTITVSWTGARNMQKTLQLSSMKSRF